MHMPVNMQEPVRIKRGRRWMTYAVGMGLWGTGAVWLVFHYFLQTKSEFGTEENPLTHWWLAAHGLFAFGMLWVFGLLWGQHIVGGWKSGRHRITGSLLFAVLAVLIATGYLLYYAAGDETRATVSLIHWGLGLAALVPFILHRFRKQVPLRSRLAEDDGETEGLI
jgi:hypothetical protein